MTMKKMSMTVFAGLFILLLTACGGASEKDEIIEFHNEMHDLTEGVEDKIDESEELFMDYVNGSIDESEYDEGKKEMESYISDKKDEFEDIDKPSKDKAVEYYDKSEAVIMDSFDTIEMMMDIPDLNDMEAAEEYEQDLSEELEALEGSISDLEDFQDELKEEDDDYKDAFEEDEEE